MNKKEALRRLLQPKSVAVFGGNSAAAVVRQCKAIGFAGEIWAVSPTRTDMGGIPCVPSIAELPGIPDASFVAAPPQASLEIIAELSALGAPGAVCFAAGFGEAGPAGEALQKQLREASGDMAIIGPNCYGFVNYLDGVALWPDEHGGHRVGRGVALITQSGNIALNLTMQQRSLDFAYVISIGNNSTLSLADYIELLLDDARVTAIGLHIEGLRDIAGFSRAAIAALRKGIPIVALKTGRSALGAEMTMSHTGSLAGSDRLYSALFERVGVARCDTVPQFLETLKLLSLVGPLHANTMGSMSCSGGEASLVADCAERLGVDMPALSADSAAQLHELLGPKVHVANPLDYHLYIWGDYAQMNACFAKFVSNSYGCTVLVLDYPVGEGADQSNWEVAENALLDAASSTGQRAVIVASLPETLPANVRERLTARGIAPMQGIEDCVFAIRAAAMVGAAQSRVEEIEPILPLATMTGRPVALDEAASKAALVEFGIRVPGAWLCAAEGTVEAADAVGYPVVLKAVAQELAHKSEAGAVAVGLQDGNAVREATRKMARKFDRFMVEEMVRPTVAELIVGVSRDASFGLALLIGTGGTLVELLRDTRSLLLPVRREDIGTALDGLVAGKLINGFRGGLAGNREAALDAIEAIAQFALHNSDTLLELDVNPLLVTPESAIAVDAFMRLVES
ncbi:MAG: acetate--CoA ligase family protein [Gammaproteobacteria bacterium]|nr:acetate--CoA ligase family protein [Gammaproteobacteria bacterium]MDH5302608.1 acetate--CoA ligase family protein [Gammaproteobacteria bacterium]MDH5322121.1 acetate--CoA ligase family protein [Gammaproteobacteria bacterium]